ncbi:MAG TPA: exodeoxyribonuclease VII large subunit [Candidatus Ozemobacteraceae bacterium]|nr:exodeoxyribonuclease VII large subunit [Candidatus Ozemobacteraceae bacterium]HQG27643.1 exodeoxyribonuclease VII large subunit [Candidatus Ozemobacteraceae bacterium]
MAKLRTRTAREEPEAKRTLFDAPPDETERESGELTRGVLSVGDVTRHIKRLLEKDSLLESVWVQGEVSNLVKAASGHWYFSLKDATSVLKAAVWAGNRRRIRHEIKNGDLIAAYGSISVYEPRGEYQLIITDLRPAGLGALYEAFEKLKAKLQEEGLFDADRKVPLPFLPRGVGIVTSPKGAVVQDIYRVIRRRFPNMPLYLVPVKVQGEGAAEEIVAGIRRLDADSRVDVIIVARGGGSLEDLWTFNDERVARAIAAAETPVISAIGHETDFTIADFVADQRAATPSVAGELVVPLKEDLVKAIADRRNRLGRALKHMIVFLAGRLAHARSCRFLRKPALLVAERRTHVANTARDLETACEAFMRRCRHAWEMAAARLTALDPRAVLARGYMLATNEDGVVVTSAAALKTGRKLDLQMVDGRARVAVEDVEIKTPGGTRS